MTPRLSCKSSEVDLVVGAGHKADPRFLRASSSSPGSGSPAGLSAIERVSRTVDSVGRALASGVRKPADVFDDVLSEGFVTYELRLILRFHYKIP